jgi:hypothetical protein
MVHQVHVHDLLEADRRRYVRWMHARGRDVHLTPRRQRGPPMSPALAAPTIGRDAAQRASGRAAPLQRPASRARRPAVMPPSGHHAARLRGPTIGRDAAQVGIRPPGHQAAGASGRGAPAAQTGRADRPRGTGRADRPRGPGSVSR